MDAPKCRLCGKVHYGQCDFNSMPDVEDSKPVKKEIKSIQSKSSLSEVIELRQRVDELTAEVESLKSAKENRKNYMRDYMRRRRDEANTS